MNVERRKKLAERREKDREDLYTYLYRVSDTAPKIGLPVRRDKSWTGDVVRYLEVGTLMQLYIADRPRNKLPNGKTHPDPPVWARLIQPVFHGWVNTRAEKDKNMVLIEPYVYAPDREELAAKRHLNSILDMAIRAKRGKPKDSLIRRLTAEVQKDREAKFRANLGIADEPSAESEGREPGPGTEAAEAAPSDDSPQRSQSFLAQQRLIAKLQVQLEETKKALSRSPSARHAEADGEIGPVSSAGSHKKRSPGWDRVRDRVELRRTPSGHSPNRHNPNHHSPNRHSSSRHSSSRHSNGNRSGRRPSAEYHDIDLPASVPVEFASVFAVSNASAMRLSRNELLAVRNTLSAGDLPDNVGDTFDMGKALGLMELEKAASASRASTSRPESCLVNNPLDMLKSVWS